MITQIPFPHYASTTASPTNVQRFNINANNYAFSMMFYAPRTGTIRYVWWHLGSFTAGTNPHTLSLQGVNSSTGFPDGVNKATPVNLTGLTAGKQRTNLGADIAVTLNEVVSAVWQAPSSGSGAVRVDYFTLRPTIGTLYERVPYGASFTTSWTKTDWARFAVEYSDGTVYPISDTFIDTVGAAYSSTTGLGNRIELPETVTICGLWGSLAANQSHTLRLYGPDGALLRTASVPPHPVGRDTTATNFRRTMAYVDPITIKGGATITAFLQPSGTPTLYRLVPWNPGGAPVEQIVPDLRFVYAVEGSTWPFALTASGRNAIAMVGIVVDRRFRSYPTSRNRVIRTTK